MRGVLVAAAISAVGGLFGCRSSQEPLVASAIAGLPEYTPEESTVFDDVLAPTVFGSKPSGAPEEDPNFAVRVKYADWIGRARISTVSKEVLADKDRYSLALTPDGQGMAGALTAAGPLELRIPRGSPAFLKLEAAQDRLIGMHVILFLRRYADRGEPQNHWHGDADDPAVASAVEHQRALVANGPQAQQKD
jgi:hypothetical protein